MKEETRLASSVCGWRLHCDLLETAGIILHVSNQIDTVDHGDRLQF